LAQSRQGPVALRAKIVLMLADNPNVSRVAQRLDVDRKTVRQWRERYLSEGIAGLKDRPRSGRPVEINALVRCQVVAMACGKPADFNVPCANVWTLDRLYGALVKVLQDWGVATISRASMVRILNHADMKPHKMRMWLHSPDPEFRRKVTEICELYLSPPEGALVLCVDEKTGMQALGRKHPPKQPKPGRAGRFEYEYIRNGTRKLLAAFNTQTGELDGEVREHRRAADLVEFMENVAKRHPSGDIHIVWDNLNIHHEGRDERWSKFNQRHGNRFHFHYTPLHASWVNQVELFFGILQRRVLRYGVFNSLDELDLAVLRFIDHWNAHERHPFNWSFKGYPLQHGCKEAHTSLPLAVDSTHDGESQNALRGRRRVAASTGRLRRSRASTRKTSGQVAHALQ
jgi:transposase